VFGQDGAQQRDPDESGGQSATAFLDIRGQPIHQRRYQLLRSQVEGEGEKVSGLGVALDRPVACNVGLDEGRADRGVQGSVLGRRLVPTEHFSRLRHEFGAAREVRGGQQFTRGVGVDLQPVAISVAGAVAPAQVGVVTADMSHPRGHRVEAAFQHSAVAVLAPQQPRDDHSGIAPGRGAFPVQCDQWSDIAKRTVAVLSVEHVGHPAREERCDVGVPGRGRREDLRVGEPAEPFVALRAVGGHRDEIPALAPSDVGLQLVDHRVRALEAAGERSVAVQDPGQDVLGLEQAGIAADFHVTETVKGELRFEELACLAGGDVAVSRPRPAQIVEVELAIGEHLSVAQHDPLSACRSAYPQPYPPHQVLSEIDDEAIRTARINCDRPQLPGDPHRVVGLCDERSGLGVEHRDGPEADSQRTRGIPTRYTSPSVDVLAHEEVRRPD
jgi:hypothetical protein